MTDLLWLSASNISKPRSAWYRFLRSGRDVRDVPRRIRWFIQRGRRGYSDRDLWSLDHYLLSWLPEALDTFKERTHGYPEGITSEEWDEILTKIADDLREARFASNFGDEDRMISIDEREEILTTKFDETWELLGKWFFSLWD